LIGNREAAAYLAGIGTRRVVVLALTLCGLAAALGASCLPAKAYRDGRCLSAASNRRGCCRRYKYPRWPRSLSKHVVRHHINRSRQFGAIDHADVRSEPADYTAPSLSPCRSSMAALTKLRVERKRPMCCQQPWHGPCPLVFFRGMWVWPSDDCSLRLSRWSVFDPRAWGRRRPSGSRSRRVFAHISVALDAPLTYKHLAFRVVFASVFSVARAPWVPS